MATAHVQQHSAGVLIELLLATFQKASNSWGEQAVER
jgi:hypothetical protein